jgi:hypothetical protein
MRNKLIKSIEKMFNSINNKLISTSKGYQNKRTHLIIINNEINEKSVQKGNKRGLHPILWERNQKKIKINSVSFK